MLIWITYNRWPYIFRPWLSWNACRQCEIDKTQDCTNVGKDYLWFFSPHTIPIYFHLSKLCSVLLVDHCFIYVCFLTNLNFPWIMILCRELHEIISIKLIVLWSICYVCCKINCLFHLWSMCLWTDEFSQPSWVNFIFGKFSSFHQVSKYVFETLKNIVDLCKTCSRRESRIAIENSLHSKLTKTPPKYKY